MYKIHPSCGKSLPKEQNQNREKRGWNCHPNTPSLYIILFNVRAKEERLRFPLLDVERSDCAIVMLLHLL